MNTRKSLNQIRKQRQGRTRAKLGKELPRLTVFRSNRFLRAQLISDAAGETLTAVTERDLPPAELKKAKRLQAAALGEILAKKALEKGIKQAVFDRGGYAYHGRVAAFAEGARKGGLKL